MVWHVSPRSGAAKQGIAFGEFGNTPFLGASIPGPVPKAAKRPFSGNAMIKGCFPPRHTGESSHSFFHGKAFRQVQVVKALLRFGDRINA